MKFHIKKKLTFLLALHCIESCVGALVNEQNHCCLLGLKATWCISVMSLAPLRSSTVITR